MVRPRTRRRRHSAEQKAEALKRHHLQKQEVSTICEDLKLNPSLFYTWQRALFENTTMALEARNITTRGLSRERELEREIAAGSGRRIGKDPIGSLS